jgi:hypothetical protein
VRCSFVSFRFTIVLVILVIGRRRRHPSAPNHPTSNRQLSSLLWRRKSSWPRTPVTVASQRLLVCCRRPTVYRSGLAYRGATTPQPQPRLARELPDAAYRN